MKEGKKQYELVKLNKPLNKFNYKDMRLHFDTQLRPKLSWLIGEGRCGGYRFDTVRLEEVST